MIQALRKFLSRSAPPKQAATRNFTASSASRLTMDWVVSPLSSDAAMRGQLSSIRNRSRDLERNNEWFRGFLRSLENNVVGEAGIALQMRIREIGKDGKERFDEVANDKIESAWWQWGKVGRCTVCGRHSWRDVCKIVIRSIARDGEVLIRKVYTSKGFRIQLLEADLLDQDDNRLLTNGNQVRFGVEFDQYRRPVAYWMLGAHPGDMEFQRPAPRSTRIPAEEIYHLYLSDRIDQTRGLPWVCASMKALKMLHGYAEAELVAARTGAAKMGFFTTQTPDGWDGEVDESGNLRMDASPGTIEELPPGVDFKAWETDHPNSGYGDFVKSCLRGVATSLGISYNTLSSDLEGVNYSSIRAGLLDEREVWKGLQRYLIEHFCEPLFTDWLTVELLSGTLGLPYEKMWKFDVPEFQGRRWSWVDPKKDMEAAILAVRSGQTSLRRIAADSGQDIYDIARSIAADNELFASMGVTLPELTDAPKPAPVPVTVDTNQ